MTNGKSPHEIGQNYEGMCSPYQKLNFHRSTHACLVNLYTYLCILSDHLKIDKTKVLKENSSSMKDKSIAECSC